MKNRLVAIIALIIIAPFFALGDTNYLKESDEKKAERLEWWKEARFGMFIHWGVYAVFAGHHRGTPYPERIGEWIMNTASIPVDEYEKAAAMFNPVFYDADAWVKAARDAGMRYIVITSKHHDGFALWDSKVTDWDIIDATRFDRDILAELAEACRKHDVKLCFYHSIMDWRHPHAQGIDHPNYNDRKNVNPRFGDYIENYLKPQLKELLTNYGDIGILWFDGEWIPDYTSEMGKDLYQYVRSLQPDIIINNRVDKGRQGMQGLDAEGDFAGDYGTPEQEIPDTGLPGVDWESCMTMNDTWGWKGNDHNWKSAETLIHNLIDSVSKGGNYLLNVGPTPGGFIPEPSLKRLARVGDWMDLHSEAIYGAEASPLSQPVWGAYTQKSGKALYAHILEWPESGYIYVPYPNGRRFISAKLLTTGERIDAQWGEDGVTLLLPENAPDSDATVVKLDW